MVRSAMVLGTGSVLSVEQIPWLMEELSEGIHFCESGESDTDLLTGVSLEELEKKAILSTLRRENGNQAQTARILGISDRTLREKIKRYHQLRQPAAVIE